MAKEGAEAKKGPVKRPTSQKRLLQNEKKRISNKAAKTRIKTAIKTFCGLLTEKKVEDAKVLLNEINSLIDKATKKNIHKLNKSSRMKAQLAKKLVQAKETI